MGGKGGTQKKSDAKRVARGPNSQDRRRQEASHVQDLQEADPCTLPEKRRPDVERWIGVDFDETLRRYDGTVILPMVHRVKRWLHYGIPVRIVTARVNEVDFDKYDIAKQISCIQLWCSMHVGAILPIQSCKSRGMIELWDDKAVRVEPNTGRRISTSIVEED